MEVESEVVEEEMESEAEEEMESEAEEEMESEAEEEMESEAEEEMESEAEEEMRRVRIDEVRATLCCLPFPSFFPFLYFFGAVKFQLIRNVVFLTWLNHI